MWQLSVSVFTNPLLYISQLLTAAAWLHFQGSSCGIIGGPSGTGKRFCLGILLIRASILLIRASILLIRASILLIRAGILLIRASILLIRASILLIRASIVPPMLHILSYIIWRTDGQFIRHVPLTL